MKEFEAYNDGKPNDGKIFLDHINKLESGGLLIEALSDVDKFIVKSGCDSKKLALAYYTKAKLMAKLARENDDDDIVDCNEGLIEMASILFDRAIEYSYSIDFTSIVCLEKVQIEAGNTRRLLLLIRAMGAKDEGIRNIALKRYYRGQSQMLKYFSQCNNDPQDDESWHKLFKRHAISPRLVKELYVSHKFTSLDYDFRKYILVVDHIQDVAGCYDPSPVFNWVFEKDKMPQDIIFPPGHPIAGMLYMGHPQRPEFYLPYNNVENWILADQYLELQRLTEILPSCSHKYNLGSNKRARSFFEMYKEFYFKNLYFLSDDKRHRSYLNLNRERFGSLPPEEWAWLRINPDWQKMVKLCLDEGLTHYEECFRTEEIRKSLEDNKEAILAHLDRFLKNGNSSLPRMHKDKDVPDKLEWSLAVDFKFDYDDTVKTRDWAYLGLILTNQGIVRNLDVTHYFTVFLSREEIDGVN